MADRLTQLQDAVNVQAENLCNSIGLLQQSSRPTPFPEFATFSRSPSTAYKQVLIEAGIPVEIDDIDNNVDQKENNVVKNGHDNSNIINKSTEKSSNSDLKQNGDSSLMINGDGSILQQPQQSFPDPGENSKFFAKLITKTAKDIDLIIDSLPNRELESDLQEAHIKVLEMENHDEQKKLETVINQAEQLLDVIKNALEDIAQNQMRMKQLEAQMLTSSTTSTTSSSSLLSSTTNKNTIQSSTRILHNILDDHHSPD
ncbi:Mediator of RNA polymerase II transcription subunit 21 [Dermatophagoides pteronyssinus]|uniref:Mediator of RNA polymerase II transcription subunit 21 n=1 Tax=Dermatophagoides pteronyssinus TaxID=6956 RepID=A0ABQ8JM30_DERPT|nr:Mediator of RNA polymerase II transcription subunit 21 [Dermatophagoides pteronyssinus]